MAIETQLGRPKLGNWRKRSLAAAFWPWMRKTLARSMETETDNSRVARRLTDPIGRTTAFEIEHRSEGV